MTRVSDSFHLTEFYDKPLPILEIKIIVRKPNGEELEIYEKFYVDTGFTDDLKLPQSVGSKLSKMGIIVRTELTAVANGTAESEIFEAEITEINLNNTNVLKNPQPCSVSCMGGDDSINLVGLNALKNWRICLDLPKEILSIE